MTQDDPMAEIRASFFLECEDLLEAAQDGLQLLRDGEADDDTVNAVFRAVHSIKGGAGAFALDDLVAFAHRFETVLDEVRGGRYNPDNDAILLFFTCCDLLSDLVRAARDGIDIPLESVEKTSEALEAIAGAEAEDEVEDGDFEVVGLGLDLGLDLDTAPPPPDTHAGPETPVGYSIRFAPTPELYALGNEPLFLFRALGKLGDLRIDAEIGQVASLDAFDPRVCGLGWHIDLHGSASEDDIREVFEFVDGLCDLTLTPLLQETDRNAPEGPSTTDEGRLVAATVHDLTDEPTYPQAEVADRPAILPGGTEPEGATRASTSASPDPRPKGKGATATKATVRVDLERIDRLVNLVGELVINQAMLSQSVAEAGLPSNSPVASGLEDFMQLTRDIQDSVMMIRAQPVKSLFQRMSRIVREAAAGVGKSVKLVSDGENTEVDKTVIERLADPLTHMIRNAVDHGLETTATRVEAGKPAEGTVTLKAAHRSGRVVIEVGDDGGGIDHERLLATAVSKGLVPPDAALSETEIENLLFMPGFSTANEISNLSGRGVGMDVVRSAIQGLGGRISINTAAGKGTTFSISLPLTLAVLDDMVVNVASETLVVPLNTIVETLTLTAEDIQSLGPETRVVQIRNSFVPLLDLGAELGYRAPLTDYAGSIVLLIGQEDGSRSALVVDGIQDQRQVVIKGLEESYGHVPGVAAATILGDGQIALILDPSDVTANASGRTGYVAATTPLAG